MKTSLLIAGNARKFLWHETMTFLSKKTDVKKFELASVIAKMNIVKDPGTKIEELDDLFASRRALLDCLLGKEDIKLNF